MIRRFFYRLAHWIGWDVCPKCGGSEDRPQWLSKSRYADWCNHAHHYEWRRNLRRDEIDYSKRGKRR